MGSKIITINLDLYLCNPDSPGLCNNGRSESGSAFNAKEQAIFNYKDCRIVILKGKIESEKTSVILNASDDPYETVLMKKLGSLFIKQELQFGKPILVELGKESKVSADFIIHLKLPIDQNEMDELFDQDDLSMIQKPSRCFLEAFQLANDKNLEDLTYTDNHSIYRDQSKSAEYFFTGLINFLNGRQSQGLKTVRFINIDQRIVQIYNDSLTNQQSIFEQESQQYQLMLDKRILKNPQEDQLSNQLGTETKKNYDQVTSLTQVSVTSIQEKDKTEQNIRQIEYVAPLKSNKKELPVKQIEKDLPIKQVEKEQPVKQIAKEQPIKQIEKVQSARSIEKQQPIQQEEKQPLQKVETVQPIKEQAQPIKQIVNEQPVKQIEKEQPVKQLEKEQPVKQIVKEQPVKQLEKEQPVKQIEKEQPVKQIEKEQSVKQIEKEQPVKKIVKEQPVKQLEKEQPVKYIEKEQPIKQVEKQQPVIQIEKQSVKQVDQVSPTKPNEVLPRKSIEKSSVKQVVEQVSPLKQTKLASPEKQIEKEFIAQLKQQSKPTIVKKEVSPSKLVTTQGQKNLLKILLDKNQTADQKQELYNKTQNQKSHEVPQQEDDFYDIEVPEGIVQDPIQTKDEKSDSRQSDQFSGLVQDAEDSYQDVNDVQSGEIQVQSSDQQDYDEKDNEVDEVQRPQIKQQAKQPYQSSQAKQTQEKTTYVEKKGTKGKGGRNR